MLRLALFSGILAAMLPAGTSFAVEAKDKMETCKFGADDQKLEGKKRDAFIKNCMSNRNDPRGTASTKPKKKAPAADTKKTAPPDDSQTKPEG